MKNKKFLIGSLVITLVFGLSGLVGAQTSEQGQNQGQDQTMYGGVQSLETNSTSSRIPRSWPVPMPVPSPPQHAGYWGVITPDWTFQKVQDITRFKYVWSLSDIQTLCVNKENKEKGRNLGKVQIQKSIFQNLGPSGGITVVATEAPQNSDEMLRFRRHFVQIGSISGKGDDGADSERVMGEVMKIAHAAGGVLMIPANEGAQLVLDSKSSYWAFGISPSLMGGGVGSVAGGGVALGFGSGKSKVRYNAAPWQQWKIFAAGPEAVNDVARLWRTPVPAKKKPVQVQSGATPLKEGVEGVEKDPKYGAQKPDKPLDPSVVAPQSR
jgi:hypothetical protein